MLPRIPAQAVLLLLGALMAEGNAYSQLLPVVSQVFKASTQKKWRTCEAALTDSKIIKEASKLSYEVIRSHRELLTAPEDRLLVALATSYEDPAMDRLSPQGKREAQVILRDNFNWVKLAEAVLEAEVLNEQHAMEILSARAPGLIKEFLKLKDAKQWDLAIQLYETGFEKLGYPELKGMVLIRQQLAFILNRKNPGDERAEKILLDLEKQGHGDGETYGLLGRIYKDRYEGARDRGEPEAVKMAALDKAIGAYTKGFRAEQSNYYPGVNVLILNYEKGTPAALEEARQLAPVVNFALDTALQKNPHSYWALATAMQMACFARDWDRAQKYVHDAMDATWIAPWMLETSLSTLKKTRRDLIRYGAAQKEIQPLDGFIAQFETEIARGMQFEASPVITSAEPEIIQTGGAIELESVPLVHSVDQAGLRDQMGLLQAHSRWLGSTQEFLKLSYHDRFLQQGNGVALGLTGELTDPVYQSYVQVLGLQGWRDAYKKRGLVSLKPGTIETFMEQVTSEDIPIVFLIPPSMSFSKYTAAELDWLLEHRQALKNVYVVFGSYSVFSPAFVQDLVDRRGNAKTRDILAAMLNSYRSRLLGRDAMGGFLLPR